MRATFAGVAPPLVMLGAWPLAAQQDDRWQITLDQDRYVKIFLYHPSEP